MKAQELRIGNLVSQNGFFGYVYAIESALPRQEERFSDKDLVTLFDNGITTVPIEEIKPIPLTEEWLIKFGFYEDKIFCDYVINLQNERQLGYNLENNTFLLSQYNKAIGFRDLFLSEYKYIHQLQNLHFALTGGELELSSNVA